MWRLGLCLILLCLCAGCTFSRDWTKAGAYPTHTNDVTGRWIGHWRSDANGHHGQLRCILAQHSTNAYMAHFRARFWKIFAAAGQLTRKTDRVPGFVFTVWVLRA